MLHKKREAGFFEGILLVVAAFWAMFLQAFVLHKVWAMLVMPTLMLSVPLRAWLGVSLMLGLLTHKIAKEGTPSESVNFQWNRLYTSATLSLMIWLFAWVATLVS